jgi:hypothetical protein
MQHNARTLNPIVLLTLRHVSVLILTHVGVLVMYNNV